MINLRVVVFANSDNDDKSSKRSQWKATHNNCNSDTKRRDVECKRNPLHESQTHAGFPLVEQRGEARRVQRHVCELQLVHGNLMTARKGLPGHSVYSRVRNAVELMELMGSMCQAWGWTPEDCVRAGFEDEDLVNAGFGQYGASCAGQCLCLAA